jgi:hypothetical protein
VSEREDAAGASGDPARDPVMMTFQDWLDHAAACVDACRVPAKCCYHSERLGDRHLEARRAARTKAR